MDWSNLRRLAGCMTGSVMLEPAVSSATVHQALSASFGVSVRLDDRPCAGYMMQVGWSADQGTVGGQRVPV